MFEFAHWAVRPSHVGSVDTQGAANLAYAAQTSTQPHSNAGRFDEPLATTIRIEGAFGCEEAR
jgi:hypothetical protein